VVEVVDRGRLVEAGTSVVLGTEEVVVELVWDCPLVVVVVEPDGRMVVFGDVVVVVVVWAAGRTGAGRDGAVVPVWCPE
jgi:hypothetical protein